ncbi:GGDEF domain-containing protein [Pediococcus siamensis]|uniref:GGDEF domain-containing protein n=1 Tax=Pediococcus siamensis TaxID=381829 RepID=UPI0039A2257B
MRLDINLVNAGIWIAQLLVAVFFIVGFIDIYMAVWNAAFRNLHTKQENKILYRVLLILMSVGISSILHFAGYNSVTNAMMYHNVGLFILVFTLFDEEINIWEYLIRCGALSVVWTVHHINDITTLRFLISIVVLVAMMVIIRRYQKRITRHLVANAIVFAVLALDFWLTLPHWMDGIMVNGVIDEEAILMFFLMSIFTWRQHRVMVKNDQISHSANYDTMTNTKNYAAYQEDIFTAVGVARTNQQPLALAVFDIDRFKQINDKYGHLAGNIVLTGISDLVKQTLRQYSNDYQLYRTGGEEFVIIFPNSTTEEIIPVLIHCWRTVREHRFDYNTDVIKVTISIGMTGLKSDDDSIDTIYKRADDSLYDSKRHGRDTITVDGEEQDLCTDTAHKTYAYFVQNIYEIKSGMTHVANELKLRSYDHDTGKWTDPPQVELDFELRLKLITDALINSTCKKIVIKLSTAEFLNPRVVTELINFRKGVDGPESLIVEIDRVPSIDMLKQTVALYHQSDIRVMVSQIGNNRHFERISPVLESIDGIKLSLTNMREYGSGNLQDNIQFWGRIANKWRLEFILDGVINEEEASWAPSQSFITYVEGDFFDRCRLPLSA